ncbi:tol-pal system YbgF family protein [Aquiflexum sp.]|uniref:tetratricopeptide repeat protein n=1 Tax=Aquiflexum sp. TaxID=1872584 RepID=UPI00359455D9
MENKNHISQEEFEKFERYILGHMDAQEKIAFENTIASNKILSQKMEDMKVILEGVEEAAFRNHLDQIHQELKMDSPEPTEITEPADREKNKKIFPWKPLSIAASLLLTIGFFTWLLLLRSDPNERLFMAYYQEDPGLVTAMSSETNYEFDRAMVDYKSANYQEAITRWEKLIQDRPENDTLQFFLGASHLALKNTDPAVFFFDSVVAKEESAFYEDARWYLALAYILAGKEGEAKEVLGQSQDPRAIELLNELTKK